jgi:drug/metabolite transporter (DMT)-like permease
VTNGILLGLAAYASFSFGDACIKALGGELSVFEIAFFLTLFATLFLLPSKPRDEPWRDVLRLRKPWLVRARALTGLTAGLLGIVAFTSIPFAEAYALIFLAPLFVALLSAVVLKEAVGLWRWLTVLAGFLGVLLVVRPGFRALEVGHLAAVGVAAMVAASVTLLRLLAGRERRTSILAVMLGYSLVVNGTAALATGAGVPAWPQLLFLLFAGGFAAAGQMLLMLATSMAPANRIGPTQYTQLVWATLIGAFAFGERPDAVAMLGLAVVAGAGLLTLARAAPAMSPPPPSARRTRAPSPRSR